MEKGKGTEATPTSHILEGFFGPEYFSCEKLAVIFNPTCFSRYLLFKGYMPHSGLGIHDPKLA